MNDKKESAKLKQIVKNNKALAEIKADIDKHHDLIGNKKDFIASLPDIDSELKTLLAEKESLLALSELGNDTGDKITAVSGQLLEKQQEKDKQQAVLEQAELTLNGLEKSLAALGQQRIKLIEENKNLISGYLFEYANQLNIELDTILAGAIDCITNIQGIDRLLPEYGTNYHTGMLATNQKQGLTKLLIDAELSKQQFVIAEQLKAELSSVA